MNWSRITIIGEIIGIILFFGSLISVAYAFGQETNQINERITSLEKDTAPIITKLNDIQEDAKNEIITVLKKEIIVRKEKEDYDKIVLEKITKIETDVIWIKEKLKNK